MVKSGAETQESLSHHLKKHAAKIGSVGDSVIVHQSAGDREILPASSVTSTKKLSVTTPKLKGVDPAKFQSNAEYRKNFILRAAATKDKATLLNVVQVAEEHGVEVWEIVASFIKFIYTNKSISSDDINHLLKENRDLINRLGGNKQEFIRFSGQHIQPLMSNADISILESYYDFLESIKKGK